MRQKRPDARGISEIESVILMVILVVALAAIIFALVSGSLTPYLQKTALVAASAGVAYVPIDTPPTTTYMPVFDVLPRAGDPFYLSGQQNIPGGSPSLSFVLVGPDGTFAKTSGTDISSGGNLYGKSIYVYRDRWGYWVTDSMQSIFKQKNLMSLQTGDWVIKMVDDTANVILNEMTVSIAGSFVANPLAAKTIWTNTTDLSLTNSSGYSIPFTNNGVIPITGPNGLKAFQYNGTGAYIQGSDNPDLDYTGDLSLSLWLQPTAAGVNGYHQLVGKGAPGDTNENYDMFIINQRVYFEWTDRNPPNNVYHIMTDNTMPWGSPPSWNYVTMTINAGIPTIYFAGNPAPVTFYQSNIPGNNPVAAVPINLKDNNNPITIGKQNYPGAEFYYAGNMSEVSFYNRALTPAEIAANKNNYQT